MPNRLLGIVLLIGCILALGGCGTNAAPQSADVLPQQAHPTAAAEPVGEEGLPAPTVAASPIPDALPTLDIGETTISLIETETLVKADLAVALNVPVDRLQVTEVFTETWPDRELGCSATKGLFQAVPVPGYRIALSYGDEAFRYHTDRQGNFVRCLESGKPLGPIIKR